MHKTTRSAMILDLINLCDINILIAPNIALDNSFDVLQELEMDDYTDPAAATGNIYLLVCFVL